MSDFTATEINSLAGTMLLEVLRRTHLSAAPDLAAVVAEEGHRIGADGLVLYLLDHEQRCLVPAPLRRADVALAAEDRGRNSEEFVRGLVDRDIVPLAIKPVTLRMLLDLADEPAGLPASQLDLYARGLRHLVAEPGERRRRDRQTRGHLRPGQRLAVASRIAGASVICGRTAIATVGQPTHTGLVCRQREGTWLLATSPPCSRGWPSSAERLTSRRS